MKLLKNKDKTKLTRLNKELNYIQGYWFDIINTAKEHIGTITGYKIHIPLLVNDLLTTRQSFDEFKKVSPLCSTLLQYLYNNLKQLEEYNGYLYFLNNLHIKEKYINAKNEEYALTLLKEKMDVVIYSLGSTEDFDPYAKQEKDSNRQEELEKMLFKKGWIQESANNYFVLLGDLKDKRRYKEPPYSTIYDSPFKYWVKSKGRDWANALWKGVINQNKFADHWKEMKFYYNTSEPTIEKNPIPNTFLREFTITNFFEYKPAIDDSELSSDTNEQQPNGQALVVKYKHKSYCISYREIEIDGIQCKDINFGLFNQEDSSFEFDSLINEPFNHNVELWLIDFFAEFIERMYKQYIEDIKIPKSFFFYALNGGTQINLKITPLL
ncbi:hypothetical protein O0Q50_19170 [Priestia aryabhattai]|uniref:Uncharacterized protein n=1 Tax=Priestia aryabhattai TaxID=412384 RepID=A0AAX6NCR7_PRIAR|nr:hypothetical protein [Priestia aryabhattai]MDU9693295.1 hypothetical protein [Priestia aryabhattai]